MEELADPESYVEYGSEILHKQSCIAYLSLALVRIRTGREEAADLEKYVTYDSEICIKHSCIPYLQLVPIKTRRSFEFGELYHFLHLIQSLLCERIRLKNDVRERNRRLHWVDS